jgi:phosphatidylglycerol---prolipoprotein diacylglyceryl transferase
MALLSLVAAIGWKVLDRFHIGDAFAISPHGVGIAIGFLAGSYVLLHEAPKRGISEDRASTIVVLALIGAIGGSRLGYVFTHLSQFNSVVDVLKVYNGGLSLLGGILGAVLLGYLYIRRHRIPFLRGMDSAAIGLPLGIVIGRIGDLIIGDHLGKPTSWALAFRYFGGNLSGYDCVSFVGRCTATQLSGGKTQVVTHDGATLLSSISAPIAQGIGVHQTALYDFGSAMVLVLLLLYLNRKRRRTGILSLTFGLWYAGARIVTDSFRVENRFFGLTGSQWTSTVVVVVCLVTLIWFAVRPERPPAEGEEPAVPVGAGEEAGEGAGAVPASGPGP